jgi:SAM-dependent methyltransferase
VKFLSKVVFGSDYFHGVGNKYPQQGYEYLELEARSSARSIVNYVLSLKKLKLKWLDVGCAYGFYVVEINLAGIDGYGVDISEYAIREAQKKFPNLNGRLHVCDVNNITALFKAETFDVISMFQIVEHLFEPEKSLTEIAKLLKIGGILLINTPRPHTFEAETDVTHVNVKPLFYWKQILHHLGFHVSSPNLFYDPHKEGHPLIRAITRNGHIRKAYLTLKAHLTWYPCYQITATKK